MSTATATGADTKPAPATPGISPASPASSWPVVFSDFWQLTLPSVVPQRYSESAVTMNRPSLPR